MPGLLDGLSNATIGAPSGILGNLGAQPPNQRVASAFEQLPPELMAMLQAQMQQQQQPAQQLPPGLAQLLLGMMSPQGQQMPPMQGMQMQGPSSVGQERDPFEAAAARQQNAVRPPEGRGYGPMSFVLDNYIPHMAKNLMGLPERAIGAADTLNKGGDYDPGPAVDIASMMVGFPGVPGRALGSSVGRPRRGPSERPASEAEVEAAFEQMRRENAGLTREQRREKMRQEGEAEFQRAANMTDAERDALFRNAWRK